MEYKIVFIRCIKGILTCSFQKRCFNLNDILNIFLNGNMCFHRSKTRADIEWWRFGLVFCFCFACILNSDLSFNITFVRHRIKYLHVWKLVILEGFCTSYCAQRIIFYHFVDNRIKTYCTTVQFSRRVTFSRKAFKISVFFPPTIFVFLITLHSQLNYLSNCSWKCRKSILVLSRLNEMSSTWIRERVTRLENCTVYHIK